ncbi:MAG: glucosamine-6-phosphate deaminase [Candidatus Brockarchaeota archaeon]|nr:glucosamine-6-phosphate deaminase [Candidatus Brockarchaeota archaeon]MBO3808309.1 glucosamine-6-phosphate deaminase [Candidatus Brockarchaeota archaeon]
MRVIITENYEEMSRRAAKIIAERIRRKPNSVLGLATGSTPLGTYKELIRMHREEGLDFSKVVTFNLDEYYGLAPTHPQSYHYFMFENLFNHININPRNVHIPDGLAKDIKAFCENYEEEIRRAGGIDLQLLGIGRDGHIAFNEPGASLMGRTTLVALAEETIKDNARFFKSEAEVPRLAITMGCGTIMEARNIILLANGEGKADAIAATVEGPITSQITASILQMHPYVIVIVDEAAASKLRRKDYYRHVNKLLEEQEL